jgi:hypothetical protein
MPLCREGLGAFLKQTDPQAPPGKGRQDAGVNNLLGFALQNPTPKLAMGRGKAARQGLFCQPM